MKHEFTSNDLGRALDQVTYDAGKIQGVSYVTLRQFLDALPEPEPTQDDWQECAFEEVKDTDLKVRAEYPGWTAEGKPQVVSGEVIKLGTSQSNDYRGAKFIHEMDDVTLYRVPAPVVHPDPMEHHIITCHDRENDYFWNGVTGKYMGLYDPRNLYSREDFINWSPAKVVADGDS